ncbi:uncharacterized protein LOC121504835 [Cheilinus undulatus]|uniref:uncharacterized protein LOC121504835 n=1 Tax=Cheilinus undulatus TaxID=241271 RepID=UPI001BD2CB4F|nr:uncharacterized protein LOC121504835 [Cheilinus undulatus]
MASLKLVFSVTLFILESDQMTSLPSYVHQERDFLSADVGDIITLRCYSKANLVNRFYWYKQPIGDKPRLISSFYQSSKLVSFYDECSNNPRFSLDAGNGQNHLIISDVQTSDTASYYCAASYSITFELAEGTLVSVKGSGVSVPALVHQSESETIQPGGSVTLNCTVHTGTCDGEHSVYWFRNSEETHPGLIYTHGGRNDQCERNPDTETSTCVYNLSLKSVSLTHAGTYYCAVVSCGHILFGDRTRLVTENVEISSVLVYFLSGALTFTTTLSLFMALILFVHWKRNSHKGHRGTLTASVINVQGHPNEEDLHYAAVGVNRASQPRRHEYKREDECVYSRVKQ